MSFKRFIIGVGESGNEMWTGTTLSLVIMCIYSSYLQAKCFQLTIKAMQSNNQIPIDLICAYNNAPIPCNYMHLPYAPVACSYIV